MTDDSFGWLEAVYVCEMSRTHGKRPSTVRSELRSELDAVMGSPHAQLVGLRPSPYSHSGMLLEYHISRGRSREICYSGHVAS